MLLLGGAMQQLCGRRMPRRSKDSDQTRVRNRQGLRLRTFSTRRRKVIRRQYPWMQWIQLVAKCKPRQHLLLAFVRRKRAKLRSRDHTIVLRQPSLTCTGRPLPPVQLQDPRLTLTRQPRQTSRWSRLPLNTRRKYRWRCAARHLARRCHPARQLPAHGACGSTTRRSFAEFVATMCQLAGPCGLAAPMDGIAHSVYSDMLRPA